MPSQSMKLSSPDRSAGTPRCAQSSRSRTLRGALVAVLTALVTGCGSGMPTTGPVVYYTPAPPQVGSDLRVAPRPPSVGASQTLIVEGFLHAMSVYQTDYAVARQYLTPEASGAWNPDAGVQIYSDGVPVTQVGDDIVLDAPLVGKLNARGVYRAATGPGGVRHDFKLVRDGQGEWRISNPPEGLLISRYLFTSGYLGIDFHYADPGGQVLVPDPAWLPGGDGQLLRVAQRQLAGPDEWLLPAVRATNPVGVLDATLDQGTAVVTLDPGAAALGVDARHALIGELVYTLTQLPGVARVSVGAAGVTWSLPAVGTLTFTPADLPELAPVSAGAAGDLFVATGEGVRAAAPRDASPQPAPVAAGLHAPSAIAASARLKLIAGVTDSGARIAVGGWSSDQVTDVRTGTQLLRPDFSRSEELWTADASGPASFRVFAPGADGKLAAVKTLTPSAPKGTLVAFRVSPDGDRVAAVMDGAGGARVGLFRVVRTQGSVSIEGWRPITGASPDAPNVWDVGWSGATELLLLVGQQDGTTGVTRTSQDATRASDIGPSAQTGLVELAVAPDQQPVARSKDDVAYRFEADFTWGLWITKVQAVTFAN